MVEAITQVAGAIIAVAGAIAVIIRSWKIIDTKIDRVLYELSDNGGGSFKDWAKSEFEGIKERLDASEAAIADETERVKAVEAEVIANRLVVKDSSEALDSKFTEEIARTKLAERGVVDDRKERQR